MSRTDKDMPFWVVASWYIPSHGIHCPLYDRGGWAKTDPCDLPETPSKRASGRHWRNKETRCTWEADWSERRSYRYRYTRPPTKEDRHLDWYGPDRAKVRDQMTKAKHQYNGSREVEIVERVQHHHHASIKGWWD